MAVKEMDLLSVGELEIFVRCKHFVEIELSAKRRLLENMDKAGKRVNMVALDIARMEYALGMRKEFPNAKEILEKE